MPDFLPDDAAVEAELELLTDRLNDLEIKQLAVDLMELEDMEALYRTPAFKLLDVDTQQIMVMRINDGKTKTGLTQVGPASFKVTSNPTYEGDPWIERKQKLLGKPGKGKDWL